MVRRRGTRGGLGAAPGQTRHVPVLLSAMLAHLQPRDGGLYIDGTFGAGGYARAILEAAHCQVVAIDRDPHAIAAGAALKQQYGDRLVLVGGRFGEMQQIVSEVTQAAPDGVVLDVGVSSMQLDEVERGFSFQTDGPLDMRMAGHGPSAADLVNSLGETELSDLLFHLGEERRSRAIARAIVASRRQQPITRTRPLAELIARLLGGHKIDGKHPATRTFQALRIAVNDELGELARGLAAAEHLLKPGGRLVVVTFHSLEDRIAKRFLVARSGSRKGSSRHLPGEPDVRPPSFQIINQKPISPSEQEIAANPRARSAKLRAGERTSAPAWPLDPKALGVPRIAVAS
jgi:16S rRNA (cytosine1402-N4)-methyltransferase